MTEYQSNSHKSKEGRAEATREKRVQKVVSGKVTTKKNDGRKLANIFVSEDVSNVKTYIFMDVLVPAIKKLISDVARDGVDMLLYGRTGGSGKRSSSSNVSYRKYYDDRRDDRYSGSSNNRNRFDYDDLGFERRGDAEVVLDHLQAIADEYGIARVADLYDLADVTAPYTSNRYGWTKEALRNVHANRSRDGKYVLDLPKAMQID